MAEICCGAWVLDQMWHRLGIADTVRRLAASPKHRPGRKLNVDLLERVLFALVAGRALAPSSEAGGHPLDPRRGPHRPPGRGRPHVVLPGDGLAARQPAALLETVFSAVADLLQLDVDLIFFDTTSTYFDGTDAWTAPA